MMLSSNELNVLLRDERAWRRAAQKPTGEDCNGAASTSSREANWLIFRRGTSDNAFSLRFSNSLRAELLTDGLNTTSSLARSTLPRKRWDTSVRCATDGAVADPLQQLLARNLHRRRSPPKQVQPPTRSVSALRARERRRAMQRVNEEFVELERQDRREIAAACRTHWRALTAAFFHEAMNMLLLTELNDRRILFRAWQEGKDMLSSAMLFEQECLTGMTRRHFKQHCHFIHTEALVRSRILNDEKECRDLLERYAYVEFLRTLEAEIAVCKRQELRLLRRIT
ncbi:hypothetical protein ABB37_08695 [Leptomonas pyrrhocoris]|uniref:Uncharacterized protein n=1 Tax=Leptomonas pyrrhocoris TaxID=157538 RepID=A0A0M9FT40_LEPPY|nr:hypothetical protein ABB37_08695 [Leptomonas pyrrhocoris]KPA75427.1 hypothetical protein ABB37_08695 [Leptomonas pyrrhocoris]|eukprot:XP_015653866.1 hypothetical protein ABB37_08695 [Leptomonas pyrrhocoris]